MFCSQCGSEMKSSDRFCPKCGKKVEAEPSIAKSFINEAENLFGQIKKSVNNSIREYEKSRVLVPLDDDEKIMTQKRTFRIPFEGSQIPGFITVTNKRIIFEKGSVTDKEFDFAISRSDIDCYFKRTRDENVVGIIGIGFKTNKEVYYFGEPQDELFYISSIENAIKEQIELSNENHFDKEKDKYLQNKKKEQEELERLEEEAAEKRREERRKRKLEEERKKEEEKRAQALINKKKKELKRKKEELMRLATESMESSGCILCDDGSLIFFLPEKFVVYKNNEKLSFMYKDIKSVSCEGDAVNSYEFSIKLKDGTIYVPHNDMNKATYFISLYQYLGKMKEGVL